MNLRSALALSQVHSGARRQSQAQGLAPSCRLLRRGSGENTDTPTQLSRLS